MRIRDSTLTEDWTVPRLHLEAPKQMETPDPRVERVMDVVREALAAGNRATVFRAMVREMPLLPGKGRERNDKYLWTLEKRADARWRKIRPALARLMREARRGNRK